ncbi:MAG: hypothetical protein ABW167_16570 [Baekduia sp.]
MILYLSHGAPTFPEDFDHQKLRELGHDPTSEDLRSAMIAGDWFVVEPRQNPTGMRGIGSLIKADRRVLAIDLDAGTCEVVHEGLWPTPELILPISLRGPDAEGIYVDCSSRCDVRGGAIHAPECPHYEGAPTGA